MKKNIMTYEYGDAASKTVLIQPVDDHDLSYLDTEAAALKDMTGGDFYLVALGVKRWNDDLSPWEAPPVFGKERFGGRAEDTLATVMNLVTDRSKTHIIGGYSLAGLFALWTAYQTDMFSGVAAASPSVWFPGFSEYMKNNDIRTSRVYLSLGDMEERTRNPIMRTVGENIKGAYECLTNAGTDCILEWNSGNHFREPEIRTARAFAWHIMKGNRGNA